jgi:hypothetical protein
MRTPWQSLDYSEDALPMLLSAGARSTRAVLPHAPPRRASFREVPSVIIAGDPELGFASALRRMPTLPTIVSDEPPRRASLGMILMSAIFVVALSALAAIVAVHVIGPAPTAADLLGIH